MSFRQNLVCRVLEILARILILDYEKWMSPTQVGLADAYNTFNSVIIRYVFTK